MNIPVINSSLEKITRYKHNRIVSKEGPLSFCDVPGIVLADYYKYEFYKITVFDEGAYYEDNFFEGIDVIPKEGEYEVKSIIAIPIGIVDEN